MVRIAIATALMTVSIYGCAAEPAPPILTPVEVKLPIATPVYCEVGKLDKPALPIATLKVDSVPDDTIRAYAATVAILKGAVAQRDLMLAGCAAPANVGSEDAATGSGDSNTTGERVK
jgi:hypothetical protein